MSSNDDSGMSPVEPGNVTDRVDAAVNQLAHWLLGSAVTEPGWERMVADFKPSRRTHGAYLARIVEVRDGREIPGSSGILGPQTRAVPLLDELRQAAYTPDEGSWLSATLILRADGWPEPEYEVGIDLNHHEQPEVWAQEAPLDAEDVLADLARFPRERRLPAWMRDLLSDPAASAAGSDAGTAAGAGADDARTAAAQTPDPSAPASAAPPSDTPAAAAQD
ncbi:hypothetical protein NBM05_13870, partial [Rothia sp. AR01]|nr:hypothetical protein [Rothia santali]